MALKIAKLPVLILLFALPLVEYSGASFTSQDVIEENNISAGTWETESSSASYGDVVINEVMWMGSTVSFRDEWIELRNMTNKDIDIGQWTIENARMASQPALMIPATHTIPANGFFLIARYPKDSANTGLNVSPNVVNNSVSLADNGNGHLVLRDASGDIIDQAKGDTWPAGVHGGSGGVRQSMERNEIPGDGLDPNSWHTCISPGCNSGTFWKTADGDNYGTPGASNLSENDPTSSASPDKDEIDKSLSTDENEASEDNNTNGGDNNEAVHKESVGENGDDDEKFVEEKEESGETPEDARLEESESLHIIPNPDPESAENLTQDKNDTSLQISEEYNEESSPVISDPDPESTGKESDEQEIIEDNEKARKEDDGTDKNAEET